MNPKGTKSTNFTTLLMPKPSAASALHGLNKAVAVCEPATSPTSFQLGAITAWGRSHTTAPVLLLALALAQALGLVLYQSPRLPHAVTRHRP